jgi:hypothetical protein
VGERRGRVFGGIGWRGRFERRGIGGFVWRTRFCGGRIGGRIVWRGGLIRRGLQSHDGRRMRGRGELLMLVSGPSVLGNV